MNLEALKQRLINDLLLFGLQDSKTISKMRSSKMELMEHSDSNPSIVSLKSSPGAVISFKVDKNYFENDNLIIRQISLVYMLGIVQVIVEGDNLELGLRMQEFAHSDISKYPKGELLPSDYHYLVRLLNRAPEGCSAP